MPTNLPPQYNKVEERYKSATEPREKIEALEEMLSIIPKHKGTDKLRADLRRKLSKLKDGAQTKKGGSRQESSFNISREGAGQVVLIGSANTGKSALVDALTNATPEVSPAPFSTWEPTPGMMPVNNVQIQIIDTPPLNADYVSLELIDLIRRTDLALLVVDLHGEPFDQIEETLTRLAQLDLIDFVVEEAYRQKVDAVYYEGLGSGLSGSLRKRRFFRRNDGHHFMVYANDESLKRNLGARDNWSIRLADSDAGFSLDR